MISSTLTMTRTARERGYAVPAVNILDDLSLRAVVAAAVAASSPLIIQISVKTVRSIGTDLITTMFRSRRRRRRRARRAAPRPLPRPGRHLATSSARAGRRCCSTPRTGTWRPPSGRPPRWSRRRTPPGVDVESEIENIIGVEDGVGSDVAPALLRRRDAGRPSPSARASTCWPRSSAPRTASTRPSRSCCPSACASSPP